MPIIIKGQPNDTVQNWLDYDQEVKKAAAERPIIRLGQTPVVESVPVQTEQNNAPVSNVNSGVHLIHSKKHLIRKSQYLHDMLTNQK